MERRFHTLDVFTTKRFEGNPLAVVTDGDGLSNDMMQAIACEMNLSETVFVQKPTDDRALARLARSRRNSSASSCFPMIADAMKYDVAIGSLISASDAAR